MRKSIKITIGILVGIFAMWVFGFIGFEANTNATNTSTVVTNPDGTKHYYWNIYETMGLEAEAGE